MVAMEISESWKLHGNRAVNKHLHNYSICELNSVGMVTALEKSLTKKFFIKVISLR